jgi:hypothetical protein
MSVTKENLCPVAGAHRLIVIARRIGERLQLNVRPRADPQLLIGSALSRVDTSAEDDDLLRSRRGREKQNESDESKRDRRHDDVLVSM